MEIANFLKAWMQILNVLNNLLLKSNGNLHSTQLNPTDIWWQTLQTENANYYYYYDYYQSEKLEQFKSGTE